MPKTREVKVREISELPLFLTINDIVNEMGFGRTEVDSWFKERNFPAIKAGIQKVNKYDLFNWLNKKYGNPRAIYMDHNHLSNELLDQLQIMNDNFKEILDIVEQRR